MVHACRLAADYRNKFKKDVLIDLMVYRYYGHNEVDEPSYTNPGMYDVIRSRRDLVKKKEF